MTSPRAILIASTLACLVCHATSSTVIRGQAPVESAFTTIAAGEFWMGCSPQDFVPVADVMKCPDDEMPQHLVRFTRPFEIGTDEVTQAEWESVMGSNPSYFKGDRRPVEQITWDEVQEFLARWSSKDNRYRYRLPTEAEWEYAARAGTANAAADRPLDAAAWFGNCGLPADTPIPESHCETHAVGEKRPNAWGLFDMRGNVAEWVSDWYDEGYYRSSPIADPTGPSAPLPRVLGPYHVARGGSWHSHAGYLRVSDRYETVAPLKRRDIGFRIVREPRSR